MLDTPGATTPMTYFGMWKGPPPPLGFVAMECIVLCLWPLESCASTDVPMCVAAACMRHACTSGTCLTGRRGAAELLCMARGGR